MTLVGGGYASTGILTVSLMTGIHVTGVHHKKAQYLVRVGISAVLKCEMMDLLLPCLDICTIVHRLHIVDLALDAASTSWLSTKIFEANIAFQN